MTEDTLNLEDIIGLVRRNLLNTVIITLLCGVIAAVVVIQIPRKYKASSTLAIESGYFKNPAGDLIADISEQQELNAQRQALLKVALNDTFIDGLAERFKVYSSKPDTPFRGIEREYFSKRIEFVTVNANQFLISVTAEKPRESYEMLKLVLDRITGVLFEERFKKIVKVRDAIKKQFDELLSQNRIRETNVPHDELQAKLEAATRKLNTLKARFTSNHPDVIAAMREVEQYEKSPRRSIKQRLSEESDISLPRNKEFSAPNERLNELFKKLDNLEIILNLEYNREDPSYLTIVEQPRIPARSFFPDRKLFVAGGLVVGLVISFVLATFFEIRRGTLLTPQMASDVLGAPLLGELPALISPEAQLLLEGSSKRKMVALPGSGA